MSWIKNLFGKCNDKCCDCGSDCGCDEKQDAGPIDEPIEPTPTDPIPSDETPTVE